LDACAEIHLKSGCNLVIESSQITLKAGGSFITISPGCVDIVGPLVRINSGGAAGSGAGASPASPQAPKEADPAAAGEQARPPPPFSPLPGRSVPSSNAPFVSPSAKVLQEPARQ